MAYIAVQVHIYNTTWRKNTQNSVAYGITVAKKRYTVR